VKDMEFVRRVLAIFNGFHGQDGENLHFRVDGKYAPVSFFVNCNDAFWWGCADGEEITPENVGEMERALADCLALDKELDRPPGRGVYAGIYADVLFCCRVRKMRPQGATYDHLPKELWPLLDACGPPREVTPGNPKPHPSERAES
jgi:hypothetical protein